MNAQLQNMIFAVLLIELQATLRKSFILLHILLTFQVKCASLFGFYYIHMYSLLVSPSIFLIHYLWGKKNRDFCKIRIHSFRIRSSVLYPFNYKPHRGNHPYFLNFQSECDSSLGPQCIYMHSLSNLLIYLNIFFNPSFVREREPWLYEIRIHNFIIWSSVLYPLSYKPFLGNHPYFFNFQANCPFSLGLHCIRMHLLSSLLIYYYYYYYYYY